MIFAQPSVLPGEWDTQIPQGFWDTNVSPNLGQTTILNNNQQEKRTRHIEDFVVSADQRVKLKEKWK